MIERFKASNRRECEYLAGFLNENFNHDFYYTENNSRVYIIDYKSLKKLLRNSNNVFSIKEKGMYSGIILVWKSVGGGKTRHYVKVNATTPKIVKDLLTVLLWNCSQELYFKIKKDSPFLSPIKQKGFRFHGGRGSQILLKGKAINYVIHSKDKD